MTVILFLNGTYFISAIVDMDAIDYCFVLPLVMPVAKLSWMINLILSDGRICQAWLGMLVYRAMIGHAAPNSHCDVCNTHSYIHC